MELTIYLMSNMQPSVREVLKYNCRLIHYTQIFRFEGLILLPLFNIVAVYRLKRIQEQTKTYQS